jgi:hypothetical protein
MTPYEWTRGLVTLLMLTFLMPPIVDAQTEGPISAKDLEALSQTDRAAVMKAFIERRIEKVQNIDVTSVTKTMSRKYAKGRPGDLISEAGRYEYQTLRRDESYRVKSSYFVKPGDKVADSVATSHYDQKNGVVRIMAQSSGRKGTEGRIGLDHLPSMHSNRVAFHLLVGSYVIKNGCDKCEFLLESLASSSKSWDVQVNVKAQEVIITHPHHIAFFEGGTCTRKVYFDITKGMLPVRIEIDWRYEFTSGAGAKSLLWREERITMDEPKNFDGFWMPMRIEEWIRTEHGPNEYGIFLTTVKQVIFGNVKEADLPFTFPPDTEVADTLKNVWYRTGPDGDPIGPINPIGIPKDLPMTLDAEGRLIEKPSWMLRYGIWLLGIGVALLGAVVVVRRRLASQ